LEKIEKKEKHTREEGWEIIYDSISKKRTHLTIVKNVRREM